MIFHFQIVSGKYLCVFRMHAFYVLNEFFHFIQDKSMYDASHELQYLDMVIEETLRMYPPSPG